MSDSDKYEQLTEWVHRCLETLPDRMPETPFERLFDKITDAMEQYERDTMPPPLGCAADRSKPAP